MVVMETMSRDELFFGGFVDGYEVSRERTTWSFEPAVEKLVVSLWMALR